MHLSINEQEGLVQKLEDVLTDTVTHIGKDSLPRLSQLEAKSYPLAQEQLDLKMEKDILQRRYDALRRKVQEYNNAIPHIDYVRPRKLPNRMHCTSQ